MLLSSRSLPPTGSHECTPTSVGKSLGFAAAILVNSLLSFLALGFGHSLMNPGATGESFNLLAAMATIGAAIAGPVVSLLWLMIANSKSSTFRSGALAIPLFYVPMIAWFGGLILGGMLKVG